MRHNTYTGITTVAGGTLDLAPAAQNAVFNLGGADVKTGKLALRLRCRHQPGRHDRELADRQLPRRSLGHRPVPEFDRGGNRIDVGLVRRRSSKVTVMATYAGDFNLDGIVNGTDLDTWKANLGAGSAWQTGDANYDGAVNGLDLDMWKAHVGLPPVSGSSGVAGVPEPGTLTLLAAGLLGLLAFAWKKRG